MISGRYNPGRGAYSSFLQNARPRTPLPLLQLKPRRLLGMRASPP